MNTAKILHYEGHLRFCVSFKSYCLANLHPCRWTPWFSLKCPRCRNLNTTFIIKINNGDISDDIIFPFCYSLHYLLLFLEDRIDRLSFLVMNKWNLIYYLVHSLVYNSIILWRPPRLSELTPIIFYMKLTHLGWNTFN